MKISQIYSDNIKKKAWISWNAGVGGIFVAFLVKYEMTEK